MMGNRPNLEIVTIDLDTITNVERDLTTGKETTEMTGIGTIEAITITEVTVIKIVVKIVKINKGPKTQIQTSDCITNTILNSTSM